MPTLFEHLARIEGLNEQINHVERAALSEYVYEFMDVIPGMLWIADRQGRAIYISEEWAKVSGISLEKSRGFAWESGVDLRDRGRVMSKWQQFIANSQSDRTIRWTCVFRLGPYSVWVRTKGKSLWHHETLIGFAGVICEVAEYAEAVDLMRESQAADNGGR